MNCITELIKKLREDSELIESMRGVYPGDCDGSMGVDAQLLWEAAELLDEYDWDQTAAEIKAEQPKVTVTVYGDPLIC